MKKFGAWLESFFGLLVGLSLGLAVTWWIAPNASSFLTPASLQDTYKDEYRLLIASAFFATKDLRRAEARLSYIGDTDPAQALVDQALRIKSGQTESSAFAYRTEDAVNVLAILANSLITLSETQDSLFVTDAPSYIESPTITLSPFVFISQEIICDTTSTISQLAIRIRDKYGEPIPGVKILVSSEDGDQFIYTGQKPDLGDGYADLILIPEKQYSVQPLPSSIPVDGLVAPECIEPDDTFFWGSILLIFEQP